MKPFYTVQFNHKGKGWIDILMLSSQKKKVTEGLKLELEKILPDLDTRVVYKESLNHFSSALFHERLSVNDSHINSAVEFIQKVTLLNNPPN